MSEAEAIARGGRVVGRYVLYDELAAGGMATVHIGRLLGEVGFSRSVAIKRLHPQFARDPEFTSMFLEEARIAARIRHPNVVPVLDVVQTNAELFLVMEYIQGETVTRLTRVNRSRNRIVPMPVALAIAADLLAGLHAAHEAKDEYGRPLDIVHRDISPHNVMVGHDGVSRVLDFGIAKASSSASSTRDGEVKGKFAYMSPEQLSGGRVDRRADLFAASIVLWEMLTARRLFAANDPGSIVGLVLHGVIQPPSACASGLPPSLDALVMRGLDRDPNRRFSTAAEMARALEMLRLEIARPNDVGAWVNRIAGDTLKRRAQRIAEIESTGSYNNPLPPAPEAYESSRSESGMRPRSEPQIPPYAQPSQPVFNSQPAPSLAPPMVTTPAPSEPALLEAKREAAPRQSRFLLFMVFLLSAALIAGSVFVWRAGGLAPARARADKLIAGALHREPHFAQTAPADDNATGDTATTSPTGATKNGFPARRGTTTVQTMGGVAPAGSTMDLTGGDPKIGVNVGMGRGGGHGNLSEAIRNASGGGTGLGENVGSQPKAPTGNVPQRPSQGRVTIAINSVMPNVRSCLLGEDPPSRAIVTFQSDGTAKSVSVSGFAAGKPQEACIKSALMRANVDPFADETYGVPVTIHP